MKVSWPPRAAGEWFRRRHSFFRVGSELGFGSQALWLWVEPVLALDYGTIPLPAYRTIFLYAPTVVSSTRTIG